MADAASHTRLPVAQALLERERELADLGRSISSAVGGEAAVVLVEGPAGIGKSRLLAEARWQAAAEGMRVFAGRGGELEREFPFGVVRQLFEPLLVDEALAQRVLAGSASSAIPIFDTVAALGDDAREDSSFAALHGLYWLTVNLSGEGLALVVDDLHWCDRPSLRFLAYLVRRLEGLPVLVVGSLRPSEPRADATLLAELAGDPLTGSLQPGPLTRDAVAELVRRRLGEAVEPPFVAACHASTGGNPLLLNELLQGARRRARAARGRQRPSRQRARSARCVAGRAAAARTSARGPGRGGAIARGAGRGSRARHDRRTRGPRRARGRAGDGTAHPCRDAAPRAAGRFRTPARAGRGLPRSHALRARAAPRAGGVAPAHAGRARRAGRAGVKWEDVLPRASELGLAALHGSTPDVSVVGYTLGGGVGWYARSHGLSASNVVAIELVTADGELRRVDHENDPELFWALRGGGGNFGVVTAIEIRLFPIAEVYAGVLFFPWERTAEVLHAWKAWLPSVPDELTSVGRVLQFPPIEEVPAPFRGRGFVLVEAVFSGSEAEGVELLRPLRELGPELDTFAMVPPAAIAELHMDPPNPIPYLGDHQLLDELPPAAIDAIAALVGPGSGSPLVSYELRHGSGALARETDRHSALASLPGTYLSFGVGMVFGEESRSAVRARLDRVREALGEFDTGRKYLNFSEQATDPAHFYTPQTWARLQAVKAEVDPDRRFRANHAIDPAR